MYRNMIRFAERLRQAREEAKLSQERLGEAVEKDRQQVIRWEKGEAEPRFRDLERISAVLDKPVGWFFEEGGSPSEVVLLARRMEELTRAHAELAAQVARLAPTAVPQLALVGGSSLAAEPPPGPPPAWRLEPVSLPDGFFAALLGGGAVPTKSQAERMGALLRAAAKRLGLGPKGLAERLRVPVADVERVFAGKPCGGGWGVAEVAAGLGLAIEGDQVEWRLPEGHRLSKREAGFWQGQRELGKLMEGI